MGGVLGRASSNVSVFLSGHSKEFLDHHFRSEMDKEDQLQMLIEAVCQKHPNGSQDWRRAMDRLLFEIQDLQGLAKSYHVDYLEILNDIFLQISKDICVFQPTSSNSLTQNLVGWINYRLGLKYRVLDLHRQGIFSKLTASKNRLNTEEENAEKIIERQRDPRPCDILEFENESERLQRHQMMKNVVIELRHYIEEDKEGKLRKCYPRNHFNCNCQIISQRMFVKEPADKLTTIARDFGIPYQTLVAHWRRKGLPLLQEILVKIGYNPFLY